MTFLRSISLAFLFVLVCPSVRLDSQALNEKDIAKLVEEYVGEAASGQRRADIELKLLHVKPAQTTKALKAALGVAAKQPRALALAAKIWTPGVYSAAKPLVAGEHGELVVALGLMRQEKEAVEHLFDRWSNAALDSAEFQKIHAGFTSWPVELAYVDKFKAAMDQAADEARKQAAAEIIAFQLGMSLSDPESVLTDWAEFRAAREKDGKYFPPEGRYVQTKWNCGRIRRCGSNSVLTAGDGEEQEAFIETEGIKGVPPELQSGNWKVSLRVFLREADCGFHFYIGAETEGKTRGPSFKIEEKKWVSPAVSVESENKIAAKAGVWTLLTFVVKDLSDAKNKLYRVATLFVDGVQLGGERVLRGEWSALDLKVTKGEAVVTGIEALAQ